MLKKFLYYAVIVATFIVVLVIIYLTAIPKPVIAPSKNEASASAAKSVPPSFKGNEDAFKNALNLYIQKKQEGVDMTSGPCLGKVAQDWVLDIAHKPRLAVDDKPQNQCPDFINGNVKHFIELDPDGKLIGSQ